jgi:hypothetical protein
MKKPLLLLLILLHCFCLFSQQLKFKNKIINAPANAAKFSWETFRASAPSFKGTYVALLQFANTPNNVTKDLLKSHGIELLQFVPDNAFTAAIHQPINKELLNAAGIRSIVPVPAEIKVANNIFKDVTNAALKSAAKVDVLVSITKGFNVEEVLQDLIRRNISITNNDFEQYRVVAVKIEQSQLNVIGELPYIEYIQAVPPADKKLNDELRSNHKANVLQAPVSLGGENLNGKGVVIGVGDNADITTHIDLVDRVINRAPFLPEDHGVQTSGIAAGGGILDPLYRGIAPLATVVSQVFSGIIKFASTYVADFGMVVTNNSYGSINNDCEYAGTYDLYSKVLDDQAFQLPQLLHVFAVGNDGPFNLNCNRAGYHSVLGGYQSSKNILDVAWGDKNHTISPGSSYGPTLEGRLKPEISATGSEVRSPGANNSYVTDYGSSLASPAVAGGAALMIEKYRQLNSGANPKSASIKAWLMNGADDIENAGPDYKSGFGWLNLVRSLDMLKNNRQFNSTVATGASNQHVIVVPPNVTNLKVMLYWHDPAAAVFAKQALVNDLDLELVDPSSNTILPWVLDTANVTALATRGKDHLNNVEQVTIANPTAGSYVVRVKGTAVNVNASQEYFVVYDYTPPVVDLTFPSVGEPLLPGENVLVNWDAWDNSTNNFTLQFSPDNGANWTTITSAIPAADRTYSWDVPFVTTAQARVRLLRNNTSLQDESVPFVIIAQPAISLSTVQCEGYTSLDWAAISGATDYELIIKQGPEMVPVVTTTATTYTFSGLNRDSTYWFSVRPRISGNAGRRAVAISRQPNSGSCAGSISNNDLELDSIVSPNTGRKFTSTEITATNLVVRIKNLDDAPITGFDVKYSINGSAYVTQTVATTVPALGTYNHTFTGLNFSPAGTYNITAVVKKAGDPVAANDTARKTIDQLPNDPTNGYVENFESAPVFEVIGSKIGLPGLPHWDLQTTTSVGRARSFVNTGIPLNGNRAITLDASKFIQTGNTNYLIGTFNFSNLCCIFSDELGMTLDFWIKNHGQESHPDNRVWVRGSDTSPWVLVCDLDSVKSEWPGEWKRVGPIYLWHYPAIGQPSSSYKVRIGQHGVIGTSDNENFQGLTVDSFRIAFNKEDFAMVSIDTPLIKSCDLGSSVPLTIKTRGGKSLPGPIPVKYRLDGGPVVSETFFGGIGSYTFTNRLNLSAPGEHTLDVWIEWMQDNDRSNDSIVGYKIKNQPLINTFPYFENFESGAGNWYAEGHNNTWQFGTPASLKIAKAASGNKAWKTSLAGSYNDNELSYLYSPCFNTSSLANPYLSFAMALDLEQCQQSMCDAAWMEYSLDGKNWLKLGAYGDGTNWYNRPGDNVWDSAGFRRWHTASIALPSASKLQLRFVLQSDGSLIKEGVSVDDIHVYNRQYPIYVKAPVSTSVLQSVSGNGFVDFVENGRVIASINANGNNLGSTAVQAYINVAFFANVRSINNQYYHNRNITIKPTQVVQPDSTTVRFYFTDAETDTLTRATGCPTCSKPIDAYGLGVTKYDDNDDTKENGTLADNTNGTYSFINRNRVTIVPYDNGYYAEFKVKNFSEFWLNNGGLNSNQALPLQLQSFVVAKQGKDVLATWTTTNEVNVSRYEVEVSKGNAAYAVASFEKFGEVKAQNLTRNNYQFNDAEPGKAGSRYYRLKMIDKDGLSRYSEVKLVHFSSANEWMVYPNPVKGILNIVTQAEAGKKVDMRLLNTIGQVVWQQASIATGQQDKFKLDLTKLKIASGAYVMRISVGDEVKHVKVIKE